MSEFDEVLPHISLSIGNEQFLANPINTRLYTFVGRTVLENGDSFLNETRNHVFLITEETEETYQGRYIFEPRVVQQLGASMLRFAFPARLNERDIPDADEQAYQRYLTQNDEQGYGDFIPDDWT